MKVREALAVAAERLRPVSDTPRLDAELLAAHAIGVTREALLMGGLDGDAPASLAPLLDRRAAGEPVAYITGRQDFWTLSLAVTPDVLIPRADSETLIEAAVARLRGRPPSRILDLGTGSGALLLAALDHWPDATGLGVDVSPGALAVAAGNAEALGLAGRAAFRLGDWTAGIDERFDLILCNPPYVEDGARLAHGVVGFEPHGALFAGANGLDCYRLLASRLDGVAAPGAIACVEIGAGQAASAGALFTACGWMSETFRDLAGRDRCLMLER
ncbi:MAG: Peptide chain release factor N(5)-glutamine methyltransferase [uncultured Sphingomonadaceae bacterium]|uniref:Release factor glutamine methyltransferase n=1 Tax=uncultured Sphingomonadaceae bacterium TaxID=169976 RepID=A0A6J4TF99_9SPHN|nr:MAG: Peptide chain release factor N(5)-glutamine methyltransferase [uncultured Sphingomonadaceae bacterium]